MVDKDLDLNEILSHQLMPMMKSKDTITESDIWADIDAAFALPERQPGDIDAMQIMARYGIVESAARARIVKLVKSGNWQYIDVADEACRNGRRKVIRKVR